MQNVHEGSGPTIPLIHQIQCVRREIGLRERNYPRWVSEDRMKQAKADDELAAMRAVLVNAPGAVGPAEPGTAAGGRGVMLFIGCDPGLSGAIGVIDAAGAFVDVRDLPTVALPGAGTVTRRLDGAQLVKLFASIIPADAEAICFYEDVQVWVPGSKGRGKAGRPADDGAEKSGPGASTMAAMYGTKMVLLAILDCFRSRIQVKPVPPQTWKAYFGLKKIKDPALSRSQVATAFKAASRARAVGLFPDADLRKSKFDGRAEALLLAAYARARWLSEQTLFDSPVAPTMTAPTAKQQKNAEIDASIPWS